MNGLIGNAVATTLWLVLAGALVSWFSRRRVETRRKLKGEGGQKLSDEEADAMRFRLMRDAFLAGAVFLAAFVVLDFLF